jgi:hypothetical protein
MGSCTAANSLLRGLLPRPVRRAIHPVRSTAGSLKLDVCVRDNARVEAVALTPLPTYPTATVARV